MKIIFIIVTPPLPLLQLHPKVCHPSAGFVHSTFPPIFLKCIYFSPGPVAKEQPLQPTGAAVVMVVVQGFIWYFHQLWSTFLVVVAMLQLAKSSPYATKHVPPSIKDVVGVKSGYHCLYIHIICLQMYVVFFFFIIFIS